MISARSSQPRPLHHRSSLFLYVVLCLLLQGFALSCAGGPDPERAFQDGEPPKKLSTWGLFQGDMSTHSLHPDVLPYAPGTPLFSDYATKYRAVWMPQGTQAQPNAAQVFTLPQGTILLKTFAYPRPDGTTHLIETRLLVHTSQGWEAFPYVWDDDQKDATLKRVGTTKELQWTHPSGKQYNFSYVVPNANECKNCHEIDNKLQPLGPKPGQLNLEFDYPEGRQNQLDRWIQKGYLKDDPTLKQVPKMPLWSDPNSGTLEQRARAYLDANCAHCHQRNGPASNSALYLDYETQDPRDLGVCKPPVAAGSGGGDLRYSIVPGKPEESIMMYRMLSDESEVRMPELGRVIAHQEGIALIREWISAMKGTCPPRP